MPYTACRTPHAVHRMPYTALAGLPACRTTFVQLGHAVGLLTWKSILMTKFWKRYCGSEVIGWSGQNCCRGYVPGRGGAWGSGQEHVK